MGRELVQTSAPAAQTMNLDQIAQQDYSSVAGNWVAVERIITNAGPISQSEPVTINQIISGFHLVEQSYVNGSLTQRFAQNGGGIGPKIIFSPATGEKKEQIVISGGAGGTYYERQ